MPHSVAVIYVRISDSKQIGNTSLVEQEKACRQWCAEQDFAVDRVFVDEAESAKSANRPQFLKMMSYLESKRGKVAHLCVWRFDRFARNLEDDVTMRLRLKDAGVTLHSATERTDGTPAGKFLARVLGAVNELDNDVRSLRTVSGMRARVDSGRWQWVAPVGYVNSGANGRGVSMTPDAQHAPLITKLFQIAARGTHRQYELLAEARKLGLNGQRTGRPLTIQTLQRILRNPAYTGKLVAKRFGKELPGDWQPLVSEETFARVQALLNGDAERIAPEARRDERFPLRGFALCPLCNLPATASASKGSSGGTYSYLHCHRGKGHLRVRIEKAEADFVRLLDSLAPRPGQEALMQEVFRRTWKAKNSNETELDLQTRRLAALKARKQRLLLQMEEGAISDEDFRGRYRQLDGLIHAASAQIERLTDENDLDIDTALSYLSSLLWNCQLLWQTSDLDTKQRLQRAIYPEGLTYSVEEGFGTAQTEFFQLHTEQLGASDDVASPTGFEPVLPP